MLFEKHQTYTLVSLGLLKFPTAALLARGRGRLQLLWRGWGSICTRVRGRHLLGNRAKSRSEKTTAHPHLDPSKPLTNMIIHRHVQAVRTHKTQLLQDKHKLRGLLLLVQHRAGSRMCLHRITVINTHSSH